MCNFFYLHKLIIYHNFCIFKKLCILKILDNTQEKITTNVSRVVYLLDMFLQDFYFDIFKTNFGLKNEHI